MGDELAILEMEKITVYGLNQCRKQLLETLHKLEAVQVEPIDCGALAVDRQETEKSIAQFESHIASAAQALEILADYVPERSGLFSKRTPLDETYYSMASTEYDQVLKEIYEILRLSKTIRENEDSIGKIIVKQAGLEPYRKLDVPMNCQGTRKTAAQVGTLPGEWDAERLRRSLDGAELSACHAEILSATREQTAVWLIYPKSEAERYRAALREMEFMEPAFSLSHHPPEKKIAVLADAKAALEAQNQSAREELRQMADKRDRIRLFYDHLVMRLEKYQVLAKVGVTKSTFILTGFVPAKAAAAVQKRLEDRFTCYVELARPDPADNPPVEFENPGIISPVEGITGDYSMPGPHDIDPNPIMAWFYYLFFGMMFSDAGYGLLMMIVCGILGFGRVLEKGRRRMFQMFFYCGVSTTFWGIMYGSFFGDMIQTVSNTFGDGTVAFRPVFMDPVAQPLELLILSVAFGMVHILVGLGIKFYMLWRQGHRLDAVFDVGFWMLLLVGLSVMAAGMGVGISSVGTAGIAMAIAGAAGLVLTQGRSRKNIFAKLFGGIMSLYDITSYIGDILSYSRLMALGLATGVIASVINVLAALAGPSIFGTVIFILISLAGHAMNFAINMLGAYVHTNRLQYVEFYQKFYEGGGRKFKPFAMHTKYYNFSK